MCLSHQFRRNLADEAASIQQGPACGQSTDHAGRDPSGLRPQHLRRLRGLRRAQAQERRCKKERQAAHNRITDKDDPCRNREEDGCGHCHQPDRCGNENQTCNHVLQPPREEQDHAARIAWQDCGRAWVNLRSRDRAVQRGESVTGGETQGAILTRSKGSVAQPTVEMAPVCRGDVHNPLNCISYHVNRASGANDGSGPESRLPVVLAGHGPARPRPGDPDGPERQDVAAECLSFVMPQQQGAATADCEDSK